ncbi:MAG: DUF1573 domain-containing protein [Saprospiraceae bacterium]
MNAFRILLLIFTIFIAGCKNTTDSLPNSNQAKSNQDSNQIAKIYYKEYLYDFDTLNFGDSASHDFKFKNQGTTTLRITKMDAQCICATPKALKMIIEPGDSSAIRVVYHSAVTPGYVEKEVYISTNTIPPMATLRITGFVKPFK